MAQAFGQQLPEYVDIVESWVNDQDPLDLEAIIQGSTPSIPISSLVFDRHCSLSPDQYMTWYCLAW